MQNNITWSYETSWVVFHILSKTRKTIKWQTSNKMTTSSAAFLDLNFEMIFLIKTFSSQNRKARWQLYLCFHATVLNIMASNIRQLLEA